jgi:phenylpropionate dioxygenase-like ring-hydroxylating dioxygenase large terminal subunit
MFEGFANVWTPVTISSRLKDKPLALQLAGEPLVLFRGKDGQVGALLDRCPHRGVALSLGKIADGCLECPFHGWRFGTRGEVTHVPFNPDAKLERLKATSLPAREEAGAIWVFTAPGGEAVGAPSYPEVLRDPRVHFFQDELELNTHWTRGLESALDWTHVPSLHANTVGLGLRGHTARGRMDTNWEDTPYGGRITMSIDGKPNGAWIDYFRPNVTTVFIPSVSRFACGYLGVVPVSPTRTRLVVLNGREVLKTRLLDPLFRMLARVVLAQDNRNLVTSSPHEIPTAGIELSVRTDRATLQFRKYYDKHLRHSSVSLG